MNSPKIVVRKQLPASREEVFDAWLDSDGMGVWMCPGPITSSDVTIDPKVGGHFTILMKSPGGEFDHAGEFLVLERPSKLQFTWISAGTDRQETLVTVELHERGSDCELVLTHERIPRAETVNQYEEGWGHILEKLGQHLPIRQH
jgi:uncharacterized protein YndB with AHSA1/START domain